MHCLNKIHNNGKEVQIKLYPSSDVELIDRDEWQNLQDNSLFNNPFFEYWNLVPAIKNLSISNKPVWIAAIYYEDAMIGLFPITKKYQGYIIPTCCIWSHDHCYLSTPLLSLRLNFHEVMTAISIHLNCYFSHIPLHDKTLINASKCNNIFEFTYQRAVINNSQSIKHHLTQLSGKKKREIYREKKNIETLGEVILKKFSCVEEGLSEYKKLEISGWKGKEGGAILSRPEVSNYYQDISILSNGNIDIHGLFINDALVACTIRVKSKDKYYEIKTTYNEEMRKFAPGKIMELYILEDLLLHNPTYVDSCTDQDNKLINWLWPDKKEFVTRYIFSQNTKSQILKLTYTFKQWFRKTFIHA